MAYLHPAPSVGQLRGLRDLRQYMWLALTAPERWHTVLDGLHSAAGSAVGCVMGLLCFAIQFTFYAGAILSMPLMPFLAPLGLLPAALVFGLVIVTVGQLFRVLAFL